MQLETKIPRAGVPKLNLESEVEWSVQRCPSTANDEFERSGICAFADASESLQRIPRISIAPH